MDNGSSATLGNAKNMSTSSAEQANDATLADSEAVIPAAMETCMLSGNCKCFTALMATRNPHRTTYRG